MGCAQTGALSSKLPQVSMAREETSSVTCSCPSPDLPAVGCRAAPVPTFARGRSAAEWAPRVRLKMAIWPEVSADCGWDPLPAGSHVERVHVLCTLGRLVLAGAWRCHLETGLSGVGGSHSVGHSASVRLSKPRDQSGNDSRSTNSRWWSWFIA